MLDSPFLFLNRFCFLFVEVLRYNTVSFVQKCHNFLSSTSAINGLSFKSPSVSFVFARLHLSFSLSLPPSLTNTSQQDMHIISTDEKQVFAAVQEWNQNNTYSLYISDSPGVYFTLSLENLRTNRGPAGNLLVDFYKVLISSSALACCCY